MGWAHANLLVRLGNFAAIQLSPQSDCPNLGRIKCMPMRQTGYFLSKTATLSKFPA
jgi:hypothetical protein